MAFLFCKKLIRIFMKLLFLSCIEKAADLLVGCRAFRINFLSISAISLQQTTAADRLPAAVIRD
jgi:hypothetical protein